MPSSIAKTLCAALLVTSAFVSSTVADDQHHINHVRSPKHARRNTQQTEAGPSSLAKRGPTYSGRATYFDVGLGACGGWSTPNQYVVAMNEGQYGDMSQQSWYCGKTLAITHNGNTQYAQVVDACPGCPWGALDMSTGLFSALNNGNMDAGVFQMTWTLVDGSDSGNNNNNNQNTWQNTWTQNTWTDNTRTQNTWTQPTTTSSQQQQIPAAAPTSSSSSSSPTPAPTHSSSSSSSSASSSSSPAPQVPSNLENFALINKGLNQFVNIAGNGPTV